MSTQAITVGEAIEQLSKLDPTLPLIDDNGSPVAGFSQRYAGRFSLIRSAVVHNELEVAPRLTSTQEAYDAAMRSKHELPCPCGCDTCNDCEKD